MRTHRSFAAILLLILLHTTARSATINKRIVKSKRQNTSTTRTILPNDDVKEQNPEILVAYNSGRINDVLLSLTDSRNVVSKREDARTSVDQQVDQSEIVLIEDVEDMEHALSIMEYEPQKINKKGKRKIDVPYKHAENKEPAPTIISNTYHDPPQTSKPKKIPLIPKYYPNPSQESPKPSDSELRSKSINTEYPYPISTLRPNKSRFSKNRPPPDSQITSSPEETKFENVPTTTRPYSPPPIETKKQRHHLDQIITSTPNSVSQPSRSIRKKKIRILPRDKLANIDNRRNSQENNYNKSRNSGNKNKLKRLGVRYDVAPSISSTSLAKVNEEKSDVEGVALINKNRPNASRNMDEVQPGRVVDPIRNPHGGRKVYERKNVKDNPIDDGASSSAEKKKAASYGGYYNSPLEGTDGSKLGADALVTPSSLGAYEDAKNSNAYQNFRTSATPSNFEEYKNNKSPVTPSSLEVYENIKSPNVYKNTRTSVAPSNFEDYTNNENPVTPSNLEVYGDVRDSNFYQNPVTASSLDVYGYDNIPVTRSSFTESNLTPKIYQNVKTSVVPTYEVTPSDLEVYGDSKVSTMTPSSYVFHTIKAPSVYSIGSAPSTTHQTLTYHAPSASTLPVTTWSPRTELNRLKDTEDDEEETDRRNSDVVAEATNLGDEDHDASSEHQGGYRHNHRQVYGNNDDNGRYGQKYEENNDDVRAEGSHGDEKYENSKEGGGNGAGGGKGEFEEGGGAKREEGHQEVKDEKGEKGYESWHKDEKASKGHHDKEQHSNHYDEKDGKEKEHKEEGEYHEEHQQGEKGEKAAEFDEKGEHQKGYNTKGQHSVHKKDEFEKRTEFFDEFQEGDDFEKEGEVHQEHESSKGGHEKMSRLDKADHEEHYGKKGKHETSKHHHEEQGHKLNEGKENHYEHEDMHGGKKGHEEEKKWAFKKGDGGDGGGKDHKSDR